LNTTDYWIWDDKNQYLLVWYKPEFIERHLRNYHYFLYLDSDVFFLNFKSSIEEEIIERFDLEGPGGKDICLVVPEDWFLKSTPSPRPNMFNAGIMLFVNKPETFDLLNAWKLSPFTDPDCFQYRTTHPREQACLNVLYSKHDELKKKIRIAPASLGRFGQYDSEWLVHLAGVTEETRTDNTLRNMTAALNSFIANWQNAINAEKKS